jgi:sugar-specific transcriptional regulator TrmB
MPKDRFKNFLKPAEYEMPNQDTASLEMLRKLGLNQYEAQAYLALSSGASTAGELSEAANIPRARAYDVLQQLQNNGFVAIQASRPVRYSALPILEAVKTLKSKRQKDLSDELKKIEELGGGLHERIRKMPTREKAAEEVVWTLKGRDAIYSKIASMVQKAKRHVIISSTKEGMDNKLKVHGMDLERAKQRGAEVVLVSDAQSPILEKAKFALIHQNQLPSRLVVADDEALVFISPNDEEPEEEVGLWMQSPHFTQTLKESILQKK